MDGDIEWFNMTEYSSLGWRVPISNMIMDDSVNLLTAPASDNDVDDYYLGAEEVSVIPSYAHFNTGYPFIGVDENTGEMVESDLQFFRPDITCKYDVTYNPWNICYYEAACDDNWLPGNLTFSFGTNMTTFNLPISQLQTNYTVDSGTKTYCSIAIQTLNNMKNVFDITQERHFYFGDIFFKQFVGIFDMANGMLGMAKSRYASSPSVSFTCEGVWCTEPKQEEQSTPEPPTPSDPEPEPQPDPPEPEPVDPTDPTDPTDPEEGGDSHDDMFWIWIIIGLGILILIAFLFAIYYCMQNQRKGKWAAMQKANSKTNDGDLIEKDIEDYAQIPDKRVGNQGKPITPSYGLQ